MVFLSCAVLIDGLIFGHGDPPVDYPGGNGRTSRALRGAVRSNQVFTAARCGEH